MAVSCEQMENLITQLVDDELQGDEQKQAVAHLAECVDCNMIYEKQKELKLQLESTCQGVYAPAHLRARIRRSIRESAESGFLQAMAEVLSAHRFKSAVATVALLAIIVWPYSNLFVQSSGTNQAAEQHDLRFIAVRGKILCIDCEAMKAAGHIAICEIDHHLGLQDSAGKIWNFVNAEEGKKIIHDFSLMNKTMEIEGYALPGSFQNNISVQKFRKL